MRTVRLAVAVAMCLVALLAGRAPALAAGTEGEPAAIVGLVPAPPFAMQAANGEWQGIAVDLWRHVADELQLRFEFRELAIDDLVGGLERGDLTAVATAIASADREPLMEFSHPYYSSRLAIAVRNSPSHGWLHILESFASTELLKLAGLLIGLTVLAGVLVWLCERRANPEQFAGSSMRGLGDGIWWAAVTTTTVGYGDKAPRSPAGRLIAVIWMFMAVILIALFTAQVTSSLTVTTLGSLVRGPGDLARVKVGAIADSPNVALLRERLGVVATGYPGFDEGLRALERGDIDAFVGVEPVLRHEIANAFAGRLGVIVAPLTRADYVFAFPNGSPIRKQVNRVILSYLDTDSWNATLRRYLGADP